MYYNEIIKTRLPKIIESLVNSLGKYSEYYIPNNIKIDITDPTESEHFYVSNQITSCMYVEVSYDTVEGTHEFSLEVPALVNNKFILSGKLRYPNRYLKPRYSCSCTDYRFTIRYGLSWEYNKEVISIKAEDEWWEYSSINEAKKDYPGLLKLSDEESKLLKIKLDLPKLPKELNKLVLDKIKSYDNSESKLSDYELLDPAEAFLVAFNDAKFGLVKLLSNHFYKTGNVISSTIQSTINSIFYNQDTEYNTVNYSTLPTTTSQVSTSERITIPATSKLMHRSLFTLIDPVLTPDNSKSSVANYLNNQVDKSKSTLYLFVYDKEFNKVSLSYLDYSSSKVLASSEVDYKNKKVLTKTSYKVYENEQIKDSKTYDYISMSDDDKLSSASRYIPFISSSDSIRGSMGSKFFTQSVPLIKPELPRVSTGYELDNTIVKSPVTGIVEVVTSTYLVISGVTISIPNSITAVNEVSNFYIPSVKVGDTVKEGDAVIKLGNSEQDNLGINLKVALMPYYGYNFEDGMVISESAAKRLSHYSVHDIKIPMDYYDQLQFIMPLGSIITSSTEVCRYSYTTKAPQLTKLIDLTSLRMTKSIKTPNTTNKGIIIDIKSDFSNSDSQASNEDLVNKSKSFKVNVDSKYLTKIPDLEESPCVVIRVLYEVPATLGTKLANRYGSKGVVSKIVPDDEMIQDSKGIPFDCILNSDSIISRKNISQLIEVNLLKLSDTLLNRFKSNEYTYEEFIKLLSKYRLDNYLNYSEQELKDIRQLNYVVGCFSDIGYELSIKWLEELGIDEGEQLYDPKVGRKIRNKVVASTMYFMKLYKIAEYDNVVSDSMDISSPKSNRFIRTKGFKQGEMETAALLASDLDEYVKTRVSTNKINLDSEFKLLNINISL